MDPIVTCIVLNWNGWSDTINCLKSLQTVDYPCLRVVVVDNGSTDRSVQAIREVFPEQVVLETGENLGFGAGCNRGIEFALQQHTDYIWLLNNDTVVYRDTLRPMVKMLEQSPCLGQVASVLHYAHDPGEIQAWGGGHVDLRTGTSRHFVEPMPDEKIDYLTGASMLLPRRVLEKVKGFDETFFMYFEDTDLSFRIKQLGWKLGVCAESRLLHKEGGSSGRRSPRFDGLLTASGVNFLRRYSSSPSLAIGIFVGGRALKRLVTLHLSCARAILSAWWQVSHSPASRA